jgi:DNA-binding CsgD family transcriptional regulator
VLAGRDGERSAVTRLLDGARAGRGGALVLHGLPGAGKSALLADAAAGATGMRVLTTRGVESESPLPFAALHRLLRPVLPAAGTLPPPQAAALRVAFGEAAGDGGDRFRVFLGVLGLLAEAAGERPVLALVDDAHWLDEASAAALLFAARRLEAEPVAVLFAARDGDVRTFDAGDLPALEVAGLGPAAASRLVGERTGVDVPASVLDRLVAGTGGNPLALVELAAALPADQLSGAAPLPSRLPLTRGVEQAFRDRYSRLSEPARTVLRVLAADDSGRARTVLQAAARLGAGGDALDEVERSGLARVREGAVELRHPLVRSAVYGGATDAERRRTHAALADVLHGGADADRRAWHLAAAAVEPDEAVVRQLDAAAERASRRGGLEAASAAWERAAELTADEAARSSRVYAAAESAWLAGRPSRAGGLADAARAAASDPALRADATLLRARVEWNTGSVPLAHRLLLEGARDVARCDLHRARAMAMFAAAIGCFGGRSDVGVDPVDLAAPEAADTPRRRCFADLVVGFSAAARSDWATAAPALRSALGTEDPLETADQDLLPNLGIAALHLGDDDAATALHERLLTRARASGAPTTVLYALTRSAFAQVVTGRWAQAAAGASEALRLAEGTGQPGLTALPLAWSALLAALRADAAFPATLARAETVLAEHPTGLLAGFVADILHWARGVEARAVPASSLHHLQAMSLGLVTRMAALDRMEAAVRADDQDLAAAWVRDLDDVHAATGFSWAGAAAAHGRALLAGGDDAGTHFERALVLHRGSARPFDRARTQLAYGEWLRRSRRRVAARAHLRAALETAEALGAVPWAERARAELRASGETARRREAATTPALTAQELHVARLVAQGLSNRDVAAQLFLSPRTIDFHLRNAFAKTGVSSRAELARLPLDDARSA